MDKESLFWPAELLNQIFEDVYREALRDVHKRIRERVSLEVRMHAATIDPIAAVNVCYYMRSDTGWSSIINKIKRHDDEHRIKRDLSTRTEDELWDKMSSLLLTMMNGFCKKKKLEPDIWNRSFLLDKSWASSLR